MKVLKKNTPDWVTKLIKSACKEYNRSLPDELKVVHSKTSYYSNGHYHFGVLNRYRRNFRGSRYTGWKNHIYLRLGYGDNDHKLIVLHEVAHHIACKSKNVGHTKRFWEICFDLYQKFGVDLEDAGKREGNYKKNSQLAYSRIINK